MHKRDRPRGQFSHACTLRPASIAARTAFIALDSASSTAGSAIPLSKTVHLRMCPRFRSPISCTVIWRRLSRRSNDHCHRSSNRRLIHAHTAACSTAGRPVRSIHSSFQRSARDLTVRRLGARRCSCSRRFKECSARAAMPARSIGRCCSGNDGNGRHSKRRQCGCAGYKCPARQCGYGRHSVLHRFVDAMEGEDLESERDLL